jgi:hypothetical protein
LLVGVTIWVIYRWWPTQQGSQVTALILAIAVMFLLMGAVSWTASSMAADRVRQLRQESPAREAIFTCGAVELARNPSEPARTVGITGAGCRTVTIFEGYRQVATQSLPASLSPVEAQTPEGSKIAGRIVAAQYGPVLAAAATDRLDQAANTVLGVSINDAQQLWRLECTEPLAVRFARVPAGDNPARGHISRKEVTPTVVVACAGRTVSFDPAVGPR